ncbi:MAG: hypothetical protein A2X08_17990 [Bacteroidetes bacterium GWA2_32_17]|nr:MAG: hypothetical protein A2X08_17990 [Bacteroidetes bacterium GWA2_32_17]
MKTIKIIIVDDHPTFRKGLIVQLKEIDGVTVIGEASNGKEFIDSFLNLNPDLVFMDIQMLEMNGIEATKLATSKNPSIKIIVISASGDEESLNSMLDAGAKGFLLKNVETEGISQAIKSVMCGKNYFSPELLSILANQYVEKPSPYNEKEIIRFSKREIEVLQLLTEGLKNREIADKLFLSPRTIERHRENIIIKSGAKNIVGILTYAIKNKLINI